AVFAIDHAAAAGGDAALEEFQVMIQIVDGVLLDGVGLGAELLIIGKLAHADGFAALVLEPAGGRENGELEVGVGQRLMDFLMERGGHGVSAQREPPRGAWCARWSRRGKARL